MFSFDRPFLVFLKVRMKVVVVDIVQMNNATNRVVPSVQLTFFYFLLICFYFFSVIVDCFALISIMDFRVLY